MLLLDTHAWLWTVEGDPGRVGRRSRAAIVRASARDAVRISAATIFEIVALHTAGRLRLAQTPEQWIDASLNRSGVRLAELTRAVAVDAGSIPRSALPDPLDRLLVATARQLDATFLTADSGILAYATLTANLRVQDLSR